MGYKNNFFHPFIIIFLGVPLQIASSFLLATSGRAFRSRFFVFGDEKSPNTKRAPLQSLTQRTPAKTTSKRKNHQIIKKDYKNLLLNIKKTLSFVMDYLK
jgi:hypothetical protein